MSWAYTALSYNSPEYGTTVPKHVAVLIIRFEIILFSAFFGRCTSCKNMHGMNRINETECLLRGSN
jgi:hypothetical protein